MIKVKSTKDLSREDWLYLRKSGIGGSDAAAIAGLNPWKSAFSVYLDKTSDKIEDVDNERVRVGRDLEDYVAKRFEEATGKKVRKNNYFLQSEEYPFMTANLDREVVGESAFLECKTTNSYAKKEWQEGVPIHYEIQVLHYLAVTGFEKAYIACLIGNEAFIWHEIKRDEETINYLIEIEKKFWEDLKKGIIPPPDGSNDYDNALKKKYKGNIEDEKELSIGIDRLEHLQSLKELKKATETKIKKIEQEIKKDLGDYQRGRLGSYKISWKPQQKTNTDLESLRKDYSEIMEKYTTISTSRVLRIKEEKDDRT